MPTKAKSDKAQPERTEEQVKQSLYSKATQALRERHREEFQDILEAEYKEAGLTYQRRLTKAERARKEIERLIAENPDLGLTVSERPVEGSVADADPQDATAQA